MTAAANTFDNNRQSDTVAAVTEILKHLSDTKSHPYCEKLTDKMDFEQGTYTGDLVDGAPHGSGQMVYLQNDPLDREVYEGDWKSGHQSGHGSMKFRSGESYIGQFEDNVPHGAGQFLYPTGDVEDVVMEAGVRHGQSRYHCDEDKTVEEVMFWEGQPRGPSKLLYPDGSYEERSFNDGAKNGAAKMIGNNGDVFEFQYKDNVIDGPSKYTWANGQYEEAVYVGGVKHGPGLEVSSTGDTETRTWDQGQLQGPAVVLGKNGDKLEFSYTNVSEMM